MKKKYILFAMALGLLTACDPIKDEEDFIVDNFTSEQLLEGATFEQFDAVTNEDGTVTYTPSETGNYIEYSIPRVSAVTIYYVKNGAEMQLAYGKSAGMFTFIPSRGSNPVQTVYFRFINADGEEVVATKDFTLTVAADLTAEMKLLVGDSGSKIWKWNTSAPEGRVWGNMGSDGNYSGVDFALTGAGLQWWGVTTNEEFLEQVMHTEDGKAHGDENLDATMVMNEDGQIICYDANGNEIRSGKFEVQNYSADYANSQAYCGILHTDPGSILFPYAINMGGTMPTDFEIAYLTAGRLVLVYPNGGWNGWSEGTYWQFSSESDILGCLTDGDEAKWTWDTTTGECWGNGQYASNDGEAFADDRAGQWWGVTTPEDLVGQLNHSNTGEATGEESASAYMIFTADGEITTYNGSGEEIRSGTFSVTSNNGERVVNSESGQPWQLGTLTTTEGAILFPFKINGGGEMPTEFDVMKISDDQLVLVYGGNGAGNECTYWRFRKVRE
ncbi:MAG TPA: hypothetical protein H9814_00225 [Candidatus Bacteroides merdigallinarum]|uniref:Uncharacterized protein n=1 Tax=Candidatus Bacteroides merdigallinarum TaxID=2838473 RepID=A0A9D2E6N3_9BACE|nr:hypothetical protein [Candidatus Bacteroides merdigallinarum]